MAESSSAVKKVADAIFEIALWVLGALGVLCVALLVASHIFGIRPLLVSTGSMEPMFGPNSVVLAQEIPAADAEVGQVVSIQTEDMTIPVIHRIIDMGTTPDGVLQIEMQGDANENPDSRIYEAETVEKYLFHVPGLAQGISWLSSPWGLTLMAAPLPVIFLLVFWPWGEKQRLEEEEERAEADQARRPAPRNPPATPAMHHTTDPQRTAPPSRLGVTSFEEMSSR